MPFATIHDTRMFYRLQGNAGRPVLILSHSIGTDHALWDLQVSDLLPHFQVLRYDTRGHGASDSPAGEYSIEILGADSSALTDALGISQFAFCGLSLGGAIGQWVAAHAPERVTHLVLANTSPQFVPRSNWETRIATVRQGGMAAIVDVAMQRFFSPIRWRRKIPMPLQFARSCWGPIRLDTGLLCRPSRPGSFDLIRQINAPTLVMTGDLTSRLRGVGTVKVSRREIPGAKVPSLGGGASFQY